MKIDSVAKHPLVGLQTLVKHVALKPASAVVPKASSVKLAMTVAIIKPWRNSSTVSGPEPEAR